MIKILIFLQISYFTLFANSFITPSCCKQELIQELSQNTEISNAEVLRQVYTNHRYKIIWNKQNITSLLETLDNPTLNYEGLDYHQQEIQSLASITEYSTLYSDLAKLDILATDAFLKLAKDIYEGQIDIAQFNLLMNTLEDEEKDLNWEYTKKKINYQQILNEAIRNGSIPQILNSLAPKNPQYKKLIHAYHEYTKVIQKGGFPKVSYLRDMKLSDYGEEISQLKKYLYVVGDLRNVDQKYLSFPRFDQKVENAIKSFQARHYIKITGKLDKVLIMYARKSAREKLQNIKINIERHKLFSNIMDSEYIVVNIPEFSLKYYKYNSLLDDIFVVIGREDRPTPIFSDYLEYIVLNPTWSVPQRLFKRDYLPKLIEDPHALDDYINIMSRNRIIDPTTVNWEQYLEEGKKLPYTFVQPAGEHNVLGKMKFIFPNRYNVYLHDTDAKSLTTTKYRLYSSGCIRLSKPYELLNILSQYTDYSFDTLTDIIDSGKTQYVRLRKHIPIHIRYFTALVDESGKINFRRDFYGFDNLQIRSLKSY
jgi:murein L,D-transpeptidase YcbB/YkuD